MMGNGMPNSHNNMPFPIIPSFRCHSFGSSRGRNVFRIVGVPALRQTNECPLFGSVRPNPSADTAMLAGRDGPQSRAKRPSLFQWFKSSPRREVALNAAASVIWIYASNPPRLCSKLLKSRIGQVAQDLG